MKKLSAGLILVIIYGVLGGLWIQLSDSILLYFIKDIENLSAYQSYKGWAYVLLTSILLYILLRMYEKKINLSIETLKQQEERYRFVVEGAKDGIWDRDILDNKMYLSPRWKEMLGYSDDELENSYETWESCLHPDDKEQLLFDVKLDHEKKSKYYKYVYRVKHKDGQWIWIDTRGQNIYDENANLIRMLGSDSDITEEKVLEQNLMIAKKRFELSEKVGNIGSWEYIIQTEKFWVSEQAKLIYGLPLTEKVFTKELVQSCVAHREQIDQALENLIEKDEEYNIKFEITPLDGSSKKMISSVAEVQRDTNGVAIKAIGSIQDITERHKLNTLLQNAQELLHLGSWEYATDEDILIWSSETYRIFELEEAEGITFEKLINSIPLEERDILLEAYEKSIEEHSEYSIEHRLIFPDGRVKYVLERARHFYDKNGKHISSIGTAQDITEQYLAEEEKQENLQQLEEKKEEFERMILDAPNPMILHNEDGQILMLNQAWINSAGYSHEEVPTIDIWLEHIYEDKEIIASVKEDINSLYQITQRVDEGEFTFLNKRRDLVTWKISSSPLGMINGKKTVITSAMDITELKKKDEMLINQSRHAAMGEMIGMIAHQWRQPLSVISMNANHMLLDIQMDTLDNSILEKYAKNVSQQTMHLSKTIDDFRNFFRPDKEIVKVRIKDILHQTMSIVKDSLRNNNIELESTFETDIQVDAYPRELMQVFVNIINNAKDAFQQNKIKNAKINIKVYEDEMYLNTEFCDNAGGIDVVILAKIFEPYFSTKDEKTGTGLGLYMSKMIIEDHLNGDLEVHNTLDGACFIVRLLKQQ